MFKQLRQLNLTKLFLLAILLRILIMPFFFHQDIKTYNYQSSFLKRGVFNIYTYLTDHKQSLPLKEEFVYFPLAYIFLGSYQIITSPFLGNNFDDWLADASVKVLDKIGTFRYLFILKLPYLILDLIIPFLLMKFFEDPRKRREVFIVWLFNPITMALIYFYSNIDIIPVTLSLISLLLFKNNKYLLSGLILGLAAGFKAYPLLFLPFLLLFTNKFKQIAQMLVTAIGSLILIIVPFWSQAFVNSALISGLTTRIAFPNIPIGFGESLMVGVIALTIGFLDGVIRENKTMNEIWLYLLFILLILFSGIHYHIQWLLWIIPFISIYFVNQKKLEKLGKISLIWLCLAIIIPLFYDDKSMSMSLLSAINSFYNLLPTPFLIVEKIYDPFALQSIIHSLIFGIGLIIILRSKKQYE